MVREGGKGSEAGQRWNVLKDRWPRIQEMESQQSLMMIYDGRALWRKDGM